MTGVIRAPMVAPDPGRGGRRGAAHAVRGLSFAVPAGCAVLAFQGDGAGRWGLGAAAIVSAACAVVYRRFLGDYARSLTVEPSGSLEVTADHLVVRHAGVLAEDIAIPWGAVRAVCVDEGTVPDLGDAPGPARRFLLPADDGAEDATPGALFAAGRRRRSCGVPLLAAAPAVPNLLVLLDPPVEVPWAYPFIAGPFNPPGGGPWPARPWPSPALTPAFLVAVADPAGFAAAVAAHAPVRDADGDDARYLGAGGLLG